MINFQPDLQCFLILSFDWQRFWSYFVLQRSWSRFDLQCSRVLSSRQIFRDLVLSLNKTWPLQRCAANILAFFLQLTRNTVNGCSSASGVCRFHSSSLVAFSIVPCFWPPAGLFYSNLQDFAHSQRLVHCCVCVSICVFVTFVCTGNTLAKIKK